MNVIPKIKIIFNFELHFYNPQLEFLDSDFEVLNPLIFYVPIFLFKEGQNFNTFSCSNFLYFSWFPE